jgi:hypothetical protein
VVDAVAVHILPEGLSMRAILRLMLAMCLTAGFLVLSGCGNKAAPPSPEQQQTFSIDSAKQQENGAKLKAGESKEVRTPFETVIVSKDQSGNVTYTVKGK